MVWLVGAQAQQPNVLVAADAPLFSQPDGDDDKTRIAKDVNLEQDPDRVLYAEFVERSEGWVHIKTSSHPSACNRALGTNAPLGMELWVKPNALSQVVTKQVELKGAAGAKATIIAGTAARSNVDGTWTVATKNLQVTAVIPEDAIGSKFIPVVPPETGFRGTYSASAVFGAKNLKVEATDAMAEPNGELWTIEDRCIRTVGERVEGPAPTGGGGPESRGGHARRVATWAVPTGSVLTWPDGVYAGTTSQMYRLENDGVDDPPGKLCGPGLPNLIVCFDDPASEVTTPVRYVALDLMTRDKVDPKHPKGEVKGESATCLVQIDVDKKGSVQQSRIRGCADAFAEASREAVAQWTFKPHLVGGEPVLSRTYATVPFAE